MKQLSLTLLFLLATLSALAKDGGLFQTGSVSVTELANGPGGFQITTRSVTTNSFDKHGNLTKVVTLWDFTGDGVPEESSTNTLFYDPHGNLTSSLEELDADADGTVDRRSTVVYTNLAGNPRPLLVLTDNNADGTNDEISAYTYTFDIDGRLIGIATEIDANADGVADFYSFESWTYDLVAPQLLYTNKSDLYSPGILQVITAAHYILDSHGNPESATWWRYDPNFGTTLSGTLAFTYDKFGNIVQKVESGSLPNPEGVSLATATTSFFYSRRGKMTPVVPP